MTTTIIPTSTLFQNPHAHDGSDMQRFSKLKDALDHAKGHGLFVVAREFSMSTASSTREGRYAKTTRDFWVGTSYALWNKFVQNVARPTIHEIVLAFKPARLYLDLEKKVENDDDATWTVDRFSGVVDEIVERVRSELRTAFQIQGEIPAYTCSAHRPDKFSTHVVLDVWFHEAKRVGEFLKSTLGSWYNDIIDYQVYPTNSTASLRCPFSYKLLFKKYVHQLTPPENVPRDAESFFQRTITFWRQENAGTTALTVRVPVPKGFLQFFDETNKRKRVKEEKTCADSRYDEHAAFVAKWFLRRFKLQSVTLNKPPSESAKWEYVAVPGLYCPNRRRPHKGNRTYVHVAFVDDDRFEVSLVCADVADCGGNTTSTLEDEEALNIEWKHKYLLEEE